MKITDLKVYDLEECIKASKYPMATMTEACSTEITSTTKKLGSSGKGEGHDTYLNGIRVNFDLTCTNKMWIEMERYRFVEFVSSQSTMHRICQLDMEKQCNKYVWQSTVKSLKQLASAYNQLGDKNSDMAKELYLTILYNVPSGFELTARLTTNYRALKTVYQQRKNHRLPEWREFCAEIEKLPHFKELCLKGE